MIQFLAIVAILKISDIERADISKSRDSLVSTTTSCVERLEDRLLRVNHTDLLK